MPEEEILRLTINSRGAEEGARRYSRAADEVTGSAGKASKSTSELESAFKSFAAVSLTTAAPLIAMSGHLSIMIGGVHATTLGLKSLVQNGLIGAAAGLHAFAAGSKGAAGELTVVGRGAAAAAFGLERFAKTATVGRLIVLGLQVAVAGLVVKLASDLVGAAKTAAREFAPAMNRVRTLVRGTQAQFEELSAATSSLAGTIGVDGVEAADALYQVISAMPEAAKDTSSALSVLEASLRVSRTGFASAGEAASSITGILNAFNMEASRATEISDALYTTQSLGVTTFGEIAGSIDRVAGLASSLGVEYTDLLAIVSTATSRLASDTNTVMTQTRAIMGNILRPSTEAARAANELGVEFSAAAVEAKGLNNFLLDLIQATEGRSDVLAQFFGSQEALALVVGLAQNTERLTDDVKAFADAQAESARVAEIMNNSYAAQKDLLGRQMQDVLRQMGAELERLDTQMLQFVNKAIEKWREWRDEIELAKREWQAMGLSVGAATPTFALPPVAAGPPRRGAPAALTDPTGLDATVLKVKELEQALKGSAVSAFAASGDIDTYRKAIAQSEEAVNRLILSEAERNRRAGEPGSVVNSILNLYNAETTALREQARAAEELLRALERLDSRIKSSLQVGIVGLGSSGVLLTPGGKAKFDADQERRDRFQASGGSLGMVEARGVRPDQGGRSLLSRAGSAMGGGLDSVIGGLKSGAMALLNVFNPLALVGAVFKESLAAVTPAIEALRPAVEIVAKILGSALAPILEGMFPVFKMTAIAATYLGQIMFTVAGGIAKAVGWLVEAIGWVIDKINIFGGDGGIGKLGKAIGEMGDGFFAAVDGLGVARDEIKAMEWDDLAKSIKNTTKAFTDVPKAVNLALYRQRFGTGLSGGGSSGSSGGGGIGPGDIGNPGGPGHWTPNGGWPQLSVQGGIHIHTRATNGEQILREVERAVAERGSRGGVTLLPGARVAT